MSQFCPNCGWIGEDTMDVGALSAPTILFVECPDCNNTLEIMKEYFVPLYDKELDKVYFDPVSIAQKKMKNFPERFFPVPDNDVTFNVKINGEWNGVPIGKKIQEKNEQLKRKVSGYENEQRNVRVDVERQLARKRAQQSK